MREYEGLDILLPKAEKIEKLESKRHTVYVWATKEGLISVNDLGNVMFIKLSQDPKITVSLRSDEDSRMELISEIHTQLRKAQALKLNYSSMTKETGL